MEKILTEEQLFDVIAFALDASATPNGYHSKFLFDHAVDVACALVLCADTVQVSEDDTVLGIYDRIADDDAIVSVVNSADEAHHMHEIADVEFERYVSYANSVGSAANGMIEFMDKAFVSGIKTLTDKMNTEGIEEVQEIAKNWGFTEA